MPGNEHQFVVGRALGIPLQIVLRVDRLAVLVDAEQRHVQVVARIGEVVRVAAEEGGLLLGREHQPHVGVLLIAVEPVFAALVQRDDVGTQAGLLQALALDVGDGRFARGEFLFRRFGALQRRQHRAR